MRDPVMIVIFIGIAVVVVGLAIIYRRKWLPWFRFGNGVKPKEEAPTEPPRPLCPVCGKAVEVRKSTDISVLKDQVMAKKQHGITVYDWYKLPKIEITRIRRWRPDTVTVKREIIDGELDVCGPCRMRTTGEAQVMVASLEADEAMAHQADMAKGIGFNTAQMTPLCKRMQENK